MTNYFVEIVDRRWSVSYGFSVVGDYDGDDDGLLLHWSINSVNASVTILILLNSLPCYTIVIDLPKFKLSSPWLFRFVSRFSLTSFRSLFDGKFVYIFQITKHNRTELLNVKPRILVKWWILIKWFVS